MAFPTNPIDGQTANVNGVQYTYSSALTAWGVTSSGGALTTASSVSATGNVTGGNVLTGGIVSATGNIAGSYFTGNGSQLTGISTGASNASIRSQAMTMSIIFGG